MLKKSYLIAVILLSLLFSITVQASDEVESAMSSNLTSVSLPSNAQRVLPNSVPAEINGTLEKMVAAGNGKLRQGETEVLVWAGSNYRKSSAPSIINRLTGSLKVDGWQYEVGGEEDGVTVFSLLKERGGRRAVIGFYAATDDALILAWTELLSAGSAINSNIESNDSEPVNNRPTANTGGMPRELIGSWDNGYVSMVGRQNTVTGAISPGSSNRFEYTFTADGRFSFTGIAQTTNYSCTETLFNEKNGRVRFNGSTLTLIPAKNFWRKTNSCAPNSNSERNYTLAEETYQWRIKIDDYGKRLICLDSGKGEACYRYKQ